MKYGQSVSCLRALLSLSFGWMSLSTVWAGDRPAIIPEPQTMEVHAGVFRLHPARSGFDLFAPRGTKIIADAATDETAGFLAKQLDVATGYRIPICAPGSISAQGNIVLAIGATNAQLGDEGYVLDVMPDSVAIHAPTQAGLFYGVQTLLQLLPPAVYSTNVAAGVTWQMPCVHIEDWPRFKWRGFMLDVSRHFFNKSEVETVLDAMAVHKLNTFHWHLTDDQGWRIEIKRYPKLTEESAWRQGVGFGFPADRTTAYGPDGRYGGYYTQDDIREVVAYASARHIMIVPEIEMPGHSAAALQAYPQYSCNGKPANPKEDDGDFNGIYDPANEETFQFLDHILAEVIPLFPGPYVHIGGDEVPKETWRKSADCQALMKREGLKDEDELQSWFTRRIEKLVSAHGRTMIGWSEILRGGLPAHAAVMDWIGGAREAAAAGHEVVMSPTAYCYFDYYQSSNQVSEPKAATWADPLPLNKVYAFEPMPAGLPPQLEPYILGTQGNLWTEWVPSLEHLEYMMFPRACALAEVAWSSKSSRNWDDFMRRLHVQAQRLDNMKVNYRHAAIDNPEPDPFK